MDKVICKTTSNWGLVCLPSFIALIGIILIPFQWIGTMFCFAVAILFALPVLILHEHIYAQFSIDQDGIALVYKNKIMRQIRWEEVRLITLRGTWLNFYKTSDKKEMHSLKNQIGLDLMPDYKKNPYTENICKIIKNNKQKIQAPIETFKPNSMIADLLR